MKKLNKQSGVIEWVLILALAVAGVFSLAQQEESAQTRAYYDKQDIIRATTPDDGKADW